MTICKHVHYAGRVQGVGFRYNAQRLADGFAVAGYVRNVPGGDVELVVEGTPQEVQAFLDTIARQMAEYIEQATVIDEPPGGLQGFRIRY